MRKKTYLSKIILLYWVLICVGCTSKKPVINDETSQENYVLLVSFDGFRHDYAQRYDLPNFKRLAADGASTTMMLPSFPSKTFPNHYSIITGMYPGNHGLVDNKFYVKERDALYAIADRSKVEDPFFYKGIPLWQWLQSHGMKTASYFWVGSETPIAGQFPTYYYKYDESTSNEKRIDQVFNWFELPKSERLRFVTLYFSFVDSEGHNSGPYSEQTKKATQEADRLLGLIMQKIRNQSLPITAIVVSDHGMIEMESTDETLVDTHEVSEYLKGRARFVNNGMHGHIYVKDPSEINDIYAYVQQKLAPRVSVYHRNETPKHWHYHTDTRIGDIVLACDAPYYMVPSKRHPLAKKSGKWGTHGYDAHKTPEMGAIFYAVGPSIKKGYKIDAFENIHIYPLITQLLNVKNPKDLDGRAEVLKEILK